MVKPKIIGVIHTPDHLERVKAELVSLVGEDQNFGIEPSPEDILLYLQFRESKHPIDEIYAAQKKAFGLESPKFPISELVGMKYFHKFFFGIYECLLKLGANPIAVGSRVRNAYNFNLIKRCFVDGDDFSLQDFQLNNLIIIPHFDYHVAERIRTENLDGVIIGCDHRPVARLVNGDFIDLSNRSSGYALERWENNEAFHRTYRNYKASLPKL